MNDDYRKELMREWFDGLVWGAMLGFSVGVAVAAMINLSK